MRIAYDHQVFCDQPYGGISRYILEVAKRVHNPPEAEARIYSGLHLNRYLVEEPQSFDCGLYVKHRPKTLKARMLANSVWAKAAMACWQPDVVHETYYHLTGWAPKRAKVVVTVHDMIHEIYTDLFPPDYPVLAWKRAALDRADAVVCVSETTKRDLLNFFPNLKANVAVIPHGHCYKKASDASVARVRKLTGGAPYFLYVGKRSLYKDFSTLLDAFAAFSDKHAGFKLVAFGGGNFDNHELGEIAKMPGGAGAVLQIGGDDDLLNALYEQCHAFVYPSRYEGFGIPLLEAHHAGCQIICSDTDVFQEVADGFATLFESGNQEALLDAMVSSLGAHRKTVSADTSNRLIAYTWAKSAQEHQNIYASLS